VGIGSAAEVGDAKRIADAAKTVIPLRRQSERDIARNGMGSMSKLSEEYDREA
jgi:hypothetical protein